MNRIKNAFIEATEALLTEGLPELLLLAVIVLAIMAVT